MTHAEALDFIQSVSWLGTKPGLERTYELLEMLGNPQKKLSFVHIAGTNGKGSTASMIESSLRAAGYRTGLYTSPYLFRFSERMKVDGIEIPDEDLARLTEKIKPLVNSMKDHPSEFEIITALAFDWFAEKQCDVVVLEVGMGGKWDSTNVIDAPLCSVITNIGLDHTEVLGNTAGEIAVQKAGIVKQGCPTVLYSQSQEVMDAVSGVCREKDSALTVADFSAIEEVSDSIDGQVFRYKGVEYSISLLGAHQMKNASVALETLNVLRKGGLNITDEAIKEGLSKTVWPARFEVLRRDPYFIVDGGHNPQCAETVWANLNKYFPGKKAVLLIGVLRDKDYEGLLEIMNPAACEYVTVTPDSPRALTAAQLGEYLTKRYGKKVTVCADIKEGAQKAIERAKECDGIACAVGSLYMAGEIRANFGYK